ncbi:hypothetical protein GCM10007084_20330 [Parabacteroides faecis]|nr:hypothetical protein GCM10007084_20330 [Parabacteroides faecis]
MIYIVQIHYNGNTIPDRYPEWVTEQDSIQVDYLCAECLGFGKVRVSRKVRIRRTRTGTQAANTY